MKNLCVALAVSLLSIGVAADDTQSLVHFARQHADKFAKEIPPGGRTGVGSTLTVRGSVSPREMMGPYWLTYDPEKETATIAGRMAVLHILRVFEKCTARGSFVGQNAFGVKRVVKRQDCDQFFISVPSGGEIGERVDLASTDFQATPNQFRAIDRSSMELEVDFEIIAPQKGPVVTHGVTVEDASLPSPVEQRTAQWLVSAKIRAVRLVLPGAAKPTPIWPRQ